MTQRLNLNDLLSMLFENANADFQNTPQYELLQKKREKMDLDCKIMLTQPELSFVIECFETLLEFEGFRAEHIYKCGMRDCAAILKELEIL